MLSSEIQKSVNWWKSNPHSFNPVFSEVLEYLHDCSKNNTLPATHYSKNVDFIYVTIRGSFYGVTKAQAQTIRIICQDYDMQDTPVGELFSVSNNFLYNDKHYALCN